MTTVTDSGKRTGASTYRSKAKWTYGNNCSTLNKSSMRHGSCYVEWSYQRSEMVAVAGHAGCCLVRSVDRFVCNGPFKIPRIKALRWLSRRRLDAAIHRTNFLMRNIRVRLRLHSAHRFPGRKVYCWRSSKRRSNRCLGWVGNFWLE